MCWALFRGQAVEVKSAPGTLVSSRDKGNGRRGCAPSPGQRGQRPARNGPLGTCTLPAGAVSEQSRMGGRRVQAASSPTVRAARAEAQGGADPSVLEAPLICRGYWLGLKGAALRGGRGLPPSFLVQLIPVPIQGPQVETGTHNLKNIGAIISKPGVLWDIRAARVVTGGWPRTEYQTGKG